MKYTKYMNAKTENFHWWITSSIVLVLLLSINVRWMATVSGWLVIGDFLDLSYKYRFVEALIFAPIAVLLIMIPVLRGWPDKQTMKYELALFGIIFLVFYLPQIPKAVTQTGWAPLAAIFIPMLVIFQIIITTAIVALTRYIQKKFTINQFVHVCISTAGIFLIIVRYWTHALVIVSS